MQRKPLGWHQKTQQYVAQRGHDVRSNGKPYKHTFYLGKDKAEAMRKLALIDAKRIELAQQGINHWTEEALQALQSQGATRLAKRRKVNMVDLPKINVIDLLKTPEASHFIDEAGAIKTQCWEQVHKLIITQLMSHPYNQQVFSDALQQAYFSDPLGTIERLKRMATIPGGPNINLNLGNGNGIGLDFFVQDNDDTTGVIDAATTAKLIGGDTGDNKGNSA